jgi:hypothetical protein
MFLVHSEQLFIIFSQWKVRIGDRNHVSERDDSNLLILDIQVISRHSQYNGITAYFDIAVIETETVTFSRAITPVCIPR